MYCRRCNQRVLAGSLRPASRRSRSWRSISTAPIACCHHAWGFRMTGTCSIAGACALSHCHSMVCLSMFTVQLRTAIVSDMIAPIASGTADCTAVLKSAISNFSCCVGVSWDCMLEPDAGHEFAAWVFMCSGCEPPGAAGGGILCAAGSAPYWRAARGKFSWHAA